MHIISHLNANLAILCQFRKLTHENTFKFQIPNVRKRNGVKNLPHSFEWLGFCSPLRSAELMLFSLGLFIGTVSNCFGAFANRMVAAALSIAPCWTRLFFKWCGVSLRKNEERRHKKSVNLLLNAWISLYIKLTVYAIWLDAVFQLLHFPIHFSRVPLPYWI